MAERETSVTSITISATSSTPVQSDDPEQPVVPPGKLMTLLIKSVMPTVPQHNQSQHHILIGHTVSQSS